MNVRVGLKVRGLCLALFLSSSFRSMRERRRVDGVLNRETETTVEGDLFVRTLF